MQGENRHLSLVPRTLGAAIALAVALLAPRALNADSIALRWTAPGDDGNVGRASTYELRYSESTVAAADTVTWWSNATSAGTLPAPRSAGSLESFTVAGLDSGKTYHFVIRTADEVPNWSGYSNVAVRSTSSGGGGLPTPANFVGVPVTGGVRLTWDAVTSGGVTGYHIYRGPASVAIGTLIHTSTMTETAWIDTTAQSGQAYKYSLTSYSGSNDSAPAEYNVSVPSDGVVATGEFLGYPNPASGKVTLRFVAGTASGGSGRVRLVIYDLTGHLISELIDEDMPAGETAIDWLCQSDHGNKVAPGLYNAILDTPLGRKVTRLAILP